MAAKVCGFYCGKQELRSHEFATVWIRPTFFIYLHPNALKNDLKIAIKKPSRSALEWSVSHRPEPQTRLKEWKADEEI